MNSRKVLICNSNLVETEYLRREYGLSPELVSPENVDYVDSILTIACTDPNNWERLLTSSPPKSIIFLLLANEAYESSKYEILNEYSSIRHVFIYNPPRKSCFMGLMPLISFFFYQFRYFFDRRLLFALIYAFRKHSCVRKVKLNYSWSNLPLGYTNLFISQMNSLNLIDSESSIISFAAKQRSFDNRVRTKKSRKIVFVGQVGTWYREILIESFSRNLNFASKVNSGWTGISSNEYLLSIKDSDFVLCPPGVITNETFRYYESIFAGRLPIAPVCTVQDFHLNNYWTRTLPFYVRYSHVAIARHLQNVNESTIQSYFLLALRLAAQEMTATLNVLDGLYSE